MTRRKSKLQRVIPSTKPMKIAALIMTAIQNLRETKGSTSGKIIDYITLGSDLPQGRVKPQVKAALKRGIEYGVLKRFRGHYFLPTGDDLERADRIAIRFANLPSPVPSSTAVNKNKNLKSNYTKKVIKARPAIDVTRRPVSFLQRKVKKARSMPLSLTSMTTEKSYHRDKQHSSSGSDID